MIEIDELAVRCEIARLQDEIEDLRARQCLPALAYLIANKLRRVEALRAVLGGAA